MKIYIFFIISFLMPISAYTGDKYVHGYYKSNGTYVEPYHRTTPDNSINNNYSTEGNLNPYTNESGTEPRKNNDAYGNYNTGNGMGVYPKQKRGISGYGY